ncbi:hypothetical protein FRB93_007602 [Tulasnella sp. JGI-2019a]|nr:hypothetical protein FRB93_007602 [Tulasnella sp. JGI-2019a]
MDQMSAPEVQSLIGALSLLVSDLQTSRYITAAGFAILIHDHLITLSDEVCASQDSPLMLIHDLRPSLGGVDMAEPAQ